MIEPCPVADAVAGTEETDQPRHSAAYRALLARIDRELVQASATVEHAPVEEVRTVAQGIMSGLQIAAAHAVAVFEGREAAEAWLAEHGAATPPVVDVGERS